MSTHTLTKAELVDNVIMKTKLSKKDAKALVELIFESMKIELEQGNSVKISGFGKFEVREKHARRGRNPQTGAALKISARKVLSFKASQLLKSLVEKKD